MITTHQTFEFKSIPSTTLVLYGWNEKVSVIHMLDIFESFFKLRQLKPHLVSFSRLNNLQTQNLTLNSLRMKLARCELQDICSLTLYHFLDRSDKQSEIFSIGGSFRNDYQDIEIMTTGGSLKERQTFISKFLQKIISELSPQYGYSLEMPLGNGPVYVAHGMRSASIRAETESRAWQYAYSASHGKQVYKIGKFRHVFALNVLSLEHLENRIGNITFREWVLLPGNGRLEQWKEGVWVWYVEPADRIRSANVLHFNGLLTAPDGFQNELIG